MLFWCMFNTHVPFGTSPQNCRDIKFHFRFTRFVGEDRLTCCIFNNKEQVVDGAQSSSSTDLSQYEIYSMYATTCSVNDKQ